MKVTVRRGDTIESLSKLFQIPVQLIIESNPAITTDIVRPGQQLFIPGYELEKYEVKEEQSIRNVACVWGLSVDILTVVNEKITDSSLLKEGDIIYYPKRPLKPIVHGKKNYDVATFQHDLKRLLALYPFLKKRTIGSSVMGTEIPLLELGNGERKIHVNGSFHANEWITTAVIMTYMSEFLHKLCCGLDMDGYELLPLYEKCTLHIVPLVNPDGVSLVHDGVPSFEPYRSNALALNGGSEDFSEWKANINGVDLNNQFPSKWEVEKTRKPQSAGPRDFPGIQPLTEPEALALANVTKAENYDCVIAFHTQGEEIYWGYLDLEPEDSVRLVEEFTRMTGYKAVQFIDSYAGYRDWYIHTWQRPGFTVELGCGVNPLPLSQFAKIYQDTRRIMLAVLYMW